MRPPTQPVGPPLAGPLPAGAAPVPVAEQSLLDFARRAARQPPMLALVLHLSTLRPPAPRPHHRRIARAMLQEVVQRYGGEVLGMGCGDLVLLCPQPETVGPAMPTLGGETTVDATSPYELPAFLGRLLRIDAPDPERLVSLWTLPAMAAALLAYATARSVEPLPAGRPADAAPPEPGSPETGRLDLRRPELRRPALRRPEAGRGDTGRAERRPPDRDRLAADRAAQTAMLDALAATAEAGDTAEVLRRQTAVLLPSSAADRGRLQPLFREISFSIAALEARVGVGVPARADPYLFRHLAGRLDRRMIDMLAAARGSGGLLDPDESAPAGSGGAGVPMHVNLGLAAIVSSEFDRLVGPRPGETGQFRGGIEVPLMEACADPAAFAEARTRVQAAGLRLVLDRVSHLALGLAQVWPLQPDLVKLEWSPAMARLESAEAGRLHATLARIGGDRLLLLRADTEAAVRWGMAQGIRRFQGRHVDAMLAASRLASCPHAGGCTLRQCTERAEAASEAGRRFCRNTRLLDAATPGHAGSTAWTREIA